MGYDTTEHERSGNGTARSPQTPDEDAVEDFAWYEVLHGGLLAVICTSSAVIGLNIVFDGTGPGPLSTVQLAAVGLVLMVVVSAAVGAYGVMERYKIGVVASFLTAGLFIAGGIAVTVIAPTINGRLLGASVLTVGVVLLVTSMATWCIHLATN